VTEFVEIDILQVVARFQDADLVTWTMGVACHHPGGMRMEGPGAL